MAVLALQSLAAWLATQTFSSAHIQAAQTVSQLAWQLGEVLFVVALQEQQLGLQHKPSPVPAKFKQLISDCLSPTGSLRTNRHHKLSEMDGVDTPPPRPITPGGVTSDAEAREMLQQASTANSQADSLRLTPTVSLCIHPCLKPTECIRR